MIYNETLIYDIETITKGTPDIKLDKLRLFGCYSYKTGKYYMLKKKEDIQKIINAHKYLIGFNNQGTKLSPGYDNPILEREGINLKGKIILDLFSIFKARAGEMKTKKGMLKDILMSYSLDYITRMLDIVKDDTAKEKIDYKMFTKTVLTKEEMAKLLSYTKRDVEITKKLYEWVEAYFEGYVPFMIDDDVKRKKYLTCSTAGFAYRAICKAMNWEQEYDTNSKVAVKLKGGYVSYPAGEQYEGNIYCLDFNSLYPHITIQCNIFGRKKEGEINDRPIWTGNNKWKVDGVYYSDKLSDTCELFRKWYLERLELKKNKDKREYSIKIILNTGSYGILNHSYYKKVFDEIAGRDCPGIGRQWIKYARKQFKQNGYEVIYTDTDSVYLVDKFNNEEKLLQVKDKIIKDIKDSVPFPQDTFDMGVDYRIRYMFFFKGGNKDKESDEEDMEDNINKQKGLLKKNYIFVTKDGEVVIKNLGIRKKSVSPLTRKIFWEHLVPQIKEGKIKFSKTYLRNLIMKLLEEDIKLVALRKDVGPYEQYKDSSPTSLPAQISMKYGVGIHFLIPNTHNIGVGKGKSYCTIEEFKNNKLRTEHIDLSNVWRELDYFVAPVVTKNIFEF